MDSKERARRALARLPHSSPASPDIVGDVADAILNAQKSALLAAVHAAKARVYTSLSLDESKLRRAEAESVARSIEQLAESLK